MEGKLLKNLFTLSFSLIFLPFTHFADYRKLYNFYLLLKKIKSRCFAWCREGKLNKMATTNSGSTVILERFMVSFPISFYTTYQYYYILFFFYIKTVYIYVRLYCIVAFCFFVRKKQNMENIIKLNVCSQIINYRVFVCWLLLLLSISIVLTICNLFI